MKKGILIAVAIGIIVFVGYKVWSLKYLVQSAQPISGEVSHKPGTETTDLITWDLYRNEKFGFEVSLPSDWQVREESSVDNVVFLATIGSPEPGTDNPYLGTVAILKDSVCVGTDWAMSTAVVAAVYTNKECYPNGLSVEISAIYSKKEVGQEVLEKITTWIPAAKISTAYEGTAAVPNISSISPVSGKKGTQLMIKGRYLSGFEGDRDVYMQKTGGHIFNLYDNSGKYDMDGDKSIVRVNAKEPCQKGETVYARYSGKESVCEYYEMTPGVYDVWMSAWGRKSNVVKFEVTK